jgi:streptogramin lyase
MRSQSLLFSAAFSSGEKMGAVSLAFVGGIALAAISAQAAPLSSKTIATEFGTAPPVELVAHDCGHGWHRQHWRDHLGHWHWGHCVPYVGGRTRLEHPY